MIENNMPKYKSHKTVWALKIKSVSIISENGTGSITFEDPNAGPVYSSREYMLKHNPRAGGYYVVYADGYESYSPASEFEEGYTLIEEHKPDKAQMRPGCKEQVVLSIGDSKRRQRVDMMFPVEKLLYEACVSVAAMPGTHEVFHAMELIQLARQNVSDVIDERLANADRIMVMRESPMPPKNEPIQPQNQFNPHAHMLKDIMASIQNLITRCPDSGPVHNFANEIERIQEKWHL